MPRAVRIEYAGALYHVLCRGDRREAIFEDDKDRLVFLKTLGEVCERTGWRIASYVLMSNHYHLLLETPEPNLVRGMQWFQSTYTARYNARHRQRGHVFQGRYKSIPVESADGFYGRTVSDYIHLNPARAGLTHDLKRGLLDYRWSSLPTLVGSVDCPVWLDAAVAMSWHGWDQGKADDRRDYARYSAGRASEDGRSPSVADEWSALRRGWYLGGEDFRKNLEQRAQAVVGEGQRSSFEEVSMQGHDEEAARGVLANGLSKIGLDIETVGELRPSDIRVQGLIWLIRSRTLMGDRWLAETLRCGHRSNILRAVKRMRAGEDPEARKMRELLKQ